MIDGHRRLPGQARCEDRERNGAVAGIAACLLLATTIALVAGTADVAIEILNHGRLREGFGEGRQCHCLLLLGWT